MIENSEGVPVDACLLYACGWTPKQFCAALAQNPAMAIVYQRAITLWQRISAYVVTTAIVFVATYLIGTLFLMWYPEAGRLREQTDILIVAGAVIVLELCCLGVVAITALWCWCRVWRCVKAVQLLPEAVAP
ncbi:MAG: hypothetical protein V1723_04930 [Candidatus Uhrbacteria bacterium]